MRGEPIYRNCPIHGEYAMSAGGCVYCDPVGRFQPGELNLLRAIERMRNDFEVEIARLVEARRDGRYTTADDKALGVAFRPEEDR